MKNLKASNYITIDENGFINLTETGQEIADKIYERHTFLTGWLTSIGVDPKVAAEDACKMEHAISAESFAAIKKSIAGTHENLNKKHNKNHIPDFQTIANICCFIMKSRIWFLWLSLCFLFFWKKISHTS